MIQVLLAFTMGCISTWLVTIISSALKASTILEEAMLTYAILMMSAYEVSLKQLEETIVRNKFDWRKADRLRKIHNIEFETFANAKIKQILKNIPPTHHNIIRFKNFNDLKAYVTQQYRKRHAYTK
jgi:hypothetical protein|tara:strand:+ start:1080 stop:1457 length:378 start_codon:yes stop_codon:yes gene_type:complete